MSVQAIDFISIAERIVGSEPAEIAYRIAAGRAYYGAFHCCSELARRHPAVILDQTLPTHERVYRGVAKLLMSALGAKELKKLCYLTKLIQDARNDADYEIAGSFEESRARKAIEDAKIVHDKYLQFLTTYKL